MINLDPSIQHKKNGSLFKNKIIFVIASFELGGAENQAIQLARYFNEREDFQVQVIGFGDSGPASKLCEGYDIAWKSIHNPWSEIRILRYLNLKKFGKIIRKLKPDILISYTTWPNVICGLTWQTTGAQLCIWNQRDILQGIVDISLEREAINNVPIIVTNSSIGKNFLIKKFGIAPNKIETIKNSVQLKKNKWNRKQWRQYLGADESSLIICMTANLTNFKDHATLLLAWDLVINKFKKGVTPQIMLVLAGRYGETYNNLTKLTNDLDIQKYVKFLGQIDDITGLLSATDIGALSSLSEGCPNAILEYMASGLPLVATDIPGIREVLPEHQLPYLSPPQNPPHIAELLIKLMNDRSLRQKIGKANKTYVYNNFNRFTLNEYYRDLIMKKLEN